MYLLQKFRCHLVLWKYSDQRNWRMLKKLLYKKVVLRWFWLILKYRDSFFFKKLICIHIIFKGSVSFSDTTTSTWLSSILVSFLANNFKYPLSVFECSQSMTEVPAWTASRTSWCDISPVIHKSAWQPARTLAPDPAHTPIDFISESEEKTSIRSNFWPLAICKVHIIWEGHKILQNLYLTFDCVYCS